MAVGVKTGLILFLFFYFLLFPPVYSLDFDALRDAAASDGDVVMVDGPFYVDGAAYYTLDFMMMGKSRQTIVYDSELKDVGGRTARKVLAVRDMKYILIVDPLFYAPGDPELLVAAGEYDIQNARNVAGLAALSPDDQEKFDLYLQDYRRVMEDVAEVSRITGSILYPGGSMVVGDDWSSFAYNIQVDGERTGYYSYEGMLELVAAYEKTVEDYQRMVSHLRDFAALEEFDIPEVRSRLDERLITLEDNGRSLEDRVALRRALLEDLGRRSLCGPSLVLLVPALLAFLRRTSRGLLILLAFCSVSALAWGIHEDIPAPGEMALRTVDVAQVPITLATAPGSALDLPTVRAILREWYQFPFLLEGEEVTVRGPYYHYGDPYYLLEISKDGLPTGLALIDPGDRSLIRHQKTAFQLVKALRAAETLRRDPIYTSRSAAEVRQHLQAQSSSLAGGPLKKFLADEVSNLDTGAALEAQLMDRPDFETLVKYNENLLRGYIILSNIQRVTSRAEAAELTLGFTVNMPRIEALATVASGPTAQEYYLAKRSRYTRRSLIRIATLESLADAGETPSKGYLLSSYIINDMFYTNPLIYPEATGKSVFIEEYLTRWRDGR